MAKYRLYNRRGQYVASCEAESEEQAKSMWFRVGPVTGVEFRLITFDLFPFSDLLYIATRAT